MKHSLMVVLLAAFASCDGPPAWDQTPISATARAFSANVGTAGTTTTTFGDKLGPGSSLWADSVTPMNAPSRSGAKISTLITQGHGPAVLVGALAVAVDSTAGVTVATDLDTNQEKWRLTGTNSFEANFLLTDGTTLCGVAVTTPPSFSQTAVQCVVLATGAMKWRQTLPLWLTPAQGQGYGLAGQFVIRGAALFISGGGEVGSYALETGTKNWSVLARAQHRSLIFVGDDLLVDGARDACVTGNSCLRALNPATGATVAEYAAETASFLWAEGGNAFFHFPVTGAVRSAVKYDSLTHQFSEDTTLQATFQNAALVLDFNGMQRLGGVTDVLPSGKVFLTLASGQEGTGSSQLCRYTVATRKLDWCQQIPSGLNQLRVHSNAIFVSAQSFSVFPPEPGSMNAVTDTRLYFGRWAFTLGDVHAAR